MNRSVLARQMFAAGGAAFPDLSGDGKITRKDILMGSGVPMQEGGEPQMAQLQAQADAMGISVQELLSMMEQQRQRENIDALQALRGRAQAQAMGADQYGFQGSAEFPGATTQAQADAMRANPDMASNIDEEGELYYNSQSAANKARFLRENEGMTSQDYERIFNYNRGGPVGMAMGGDPAMAQGVGSMMPPPPAMPPAQGPMGDAQAMDPQVIQGLLSEASQSIGDLDNAEDYATVINSIRGEEASIEERYEELAGIVGEEDAAQTPESVLALTQPAIMMGAVDQGIGGLAQEEMSEPVEGAMAQGIMSTVAPPPPAAPMPPAGMGGPPPVNFNQGGLVRRGDNQPVQMMQAGGEPGKFLPYLLGDGYESGLRFSPKSSLPILDSMMLQNIAESQNQSAARQALSPAAAAKLPTPELSYDERVLAAAKGAEARYAAAGLGTAAERAAELEEQKNLTQAQMLFDIAQTALTFAGPMQGERPGASAAERLAMAASATKLPQTIGARAQQQLEAKKVAGKEERALKLAAVQRGEAQVDAEIGREEARKLQELKNKTTAFKATKPFVTTKPVVIDKKTYPAGRLLNLRPAQVAQIEEADALTPYKAETGEAGAKKSYTVIEPIKVDGVLLKKGDVINVSSVEANDIKGFKTSVIPYNAPLKQGDVNVLLKDGTQKVLTPGTKAYQTAIDDGALLTGMAKVPETDPINLRMPNGDIKTFEKNSDEFKDAIKNNAVLSGVVSEKDRAVVNMIDPESGERQSVVEFSDEYYSLAKQGFAIGSTVDDPKAATTKSVRTTEDIIVNGTNIPAGTPVLLSDANIAEAQENFGADVFEPYEKQDAVNPFGKTGAGLALNYFTNGQTADGQLAIDAYAAGADDRTMESQIKAYTAPVADARGLMQKRKLPDFVVAAITKRVLADPTKKSPVPLVTLNLTQSQLNLLRPSQDLSILNDDNTVNIDRITADPVFIITGVDLTRSQGFVSSVNRFVKKFAGQFGELGIGSGYGGEAARITGASDKQLELLARNTIETARQDKQGRIFALDLQLLQEEVQGFRPGGFKTDLDALQQLRTTRSGLASKYSDAKFIIDESKRNPALFESGQVGDAMIAERKLKKLIAEYSVAILVYEANLTPGGAAANVSGGSATARSRRVNE